MSVFTLNPMKPTEFTDFITQKGIELYRDMPWRRDVRPYFILVSEIMLQQTQVDRVVPKFEAFITRFPDEAALAAASLADVLQLWQGLGYNRRAKFLHEAAQYIVSRGSMPITSQELQQLPGVGENTAGAIMTYAFNQPVIYIETNVRTVYIHHFFHDTHDVHDNDIRMLLSETIDHNQPRQFYWALMDYGAELKRQGYGRLQQSRHYKKQSVLSGSVRQMRGAIVRELTKGTVSRHELESRIGDERFDRALDGLITDGLVVARAGRVHLTK